MEDVDKRMIRSGFEKFRIALVQLKVSESKQDNIARACQFIKAAADRSARLVCLPECFNSPYGIQYFEKYAEEIPGDTSNALSKVAQQHRIYVIGGSFPERLNGKLYNTCLAYGPDGSVVARYRKIHLFDIDVPGKITFQESQVLSPGNSLATFDIGGCKAGLGICYDIRFQLLGGLYAQRGCSLLVYPGAFNMTTGPAHWKLLQRARAVDNQLFVATISPARDENATYVAWGNSMVVNPWGEVVAEADEKEQIVYADIDPAYLQEIRNSIPIGKQMRPDIYSLLDVTSKD